MSLFCKHMAAQQKAGYCRSICQGCPARDKILAKREAIKAAKASSRTPKAAPTQTGNPRHGW